MAYRKDQGRMARMTVFWSVAILIFYGCVSLHAQLLVSFPNALAAAIIKEDLIIPILGLLVTPALLIAGATLGLGLWLLYRWEQKPKNAELLIETENEMRKVHWPTLDEAISGSWSVMLTVIFLMVFLASADYVLARVARVILVGGGA